MRVELRADAELSDFDERFNITVYRVVQECLTNVVKHADATAVTVSLTQAAGVLTICVSDDGKGIVGEVSERRRFGILGIKERVHALQGEVQYESRADGGTLMMVKLPLETGIS